MEQEKIWKPVTGHEGLYEVSADGEVRSISRVSYSCCTRGPVIYEGRILSPRKFGKYLGVSLYRGGKKTRVNRYIHRLVAEAFHGPAPEGFEVAHLDGDGHHNSAENLAWVSRAENQAHKNVHGTALFGERHPNCTISYGDVQEMRRLRAEGESYASIGRRLGRATATIWNICNGVYRTKT